MKHTTELTLMKMETLDSPNIVAKQLQINKQLMSEMGQYFAKTSIYNMLSIARGSSDHAAQFLDYFFSLSTGKLAASLNMSLITLHHSPMQAKQTLAVAISQSGMSPDIIKPIEHFNTDALSTVALVNNLNSPLAQIAKWTVPLHAGEEKSVAATKSFIASLSASVSLCLSLHPRPEIQNALEHLADDLHKAQATNWDQVVNRLKRTDHMVVVGRGLGLALAQEAALKLKETCQIHAEAFSSAEFKHGPQSLVEKDFSIIVFANRGPALQELLSFASQMKARGAQVILVGPADVDETDVAFAQAHHSDLDILCGIQSFYLMVDQLARARGLHPDHPRNLTKVTKTT